MAITKVQGRMNVVEAATQRILNTFSIRCVAASTTFIRPYTFAMAMRSPHSQIRSPHFGH